MSKTPFTLEKRIQPPSHNGRPSKWPFAQMKVGDSFFASDDEAGPNAALLRPAVSSWQRRHPEFKLTTAKVEGGFRVWRIVKA